MHKSTKRFIFLIDFSRIGKVVIRALKSDSTPYPIRTKEKFNNYILKWNFREIMTQVLCFSVVYLQQISSESGDADDEAGADDRKP